MTRRNFLKIIGGSTLTLAAGGYIWAAPKASSARHPWRMAGQYPDPIRHALSYAILAPNPHNRQPWLVQLISDTEAVLYCDKDRHLDITDPFDRQITIGLGCFLEAFALASAHNGYDSNIDLFPQGAHEHQLDTRPVAHIRLRKTTAQPTPLFAYLTERRTDRTPYSSRQPSQDQLDAILKSSGALATVSADTAHMQDIIQICEAAARVEFLTPYTNEESVSLMRIGRKQIKKNPDGITLEGPAIELLNLTGSISPAALRDQTSTSFKQGLRMYVKAVQTSTGFVWITTPDNSREQQIEAGRAYMRANLQATAQGLSMHPLSQALQEYPEMEEHLGKIHDTLGIQAPHRLQMLARIGYGRSKTQSPRWPLQTRLMDS
ncbi:MAG TPA: twin-arginine translocation pathway signal protein [Hellea balneolensis]|uniref:Twin-arginine translocation pathway signal protein n=1 Tax=Hellea balneolensis TaxID=287478 RepID=A0A7C3C4N3_9PROT|nr:twin-arginine translocation pathway signal protein [Hellea balneolensis]